MDFVYYEHSKNRDWHQTITTTPSVFLNELQNMAGVLIDDLRTGSELSAIESRGMRFLDAVEILCQEAESGRFGADSMAVVKVVQDVTCKDLRNALISPDTDRAYLERELRLLLNMIRIVIHPNWVPQF